MTSPETSSPDMAEEATPSTGNRVARMIGALVGIIFISGIFAGFFQAHSSAGGGPFKPLAIMVITLFGAVAAWCAWVIIGNAIAIARGVEQMPTRERKNTWVTIAALAAGGLTGMAYSMTQELAPGLITSADGRILAPLAIAFALIWGIGGPIITRWWLGQIDEHERIAYIDGANWAAHALMFGVPIWWVLWKAGLAIQPDAADCVMAAMVLWLIVWFRRKFY